MHYRSFLKRDYKSRTTPAATRRPLRTHWRLRGLAFVAGSIVLGAVLAATHDSKTSAQRVAVPLPLDAGGHDNGIQSLGERVRLALPLPPALESAATAPAEPAPAADDSSWEEVTVKRGDTLSSIFSRLEMHSQLAPILALGEPTRALKSIHPGQTFRVRRSDQGLAELVYDLNDIESLRIWREADEFRAETAVRDLEIREARAAATIRHSLFQSGLEAGLSENLIMELATIFGWDIDFALDIREGDQFSVVYQEYYRDGEKLRDGRILAAEFINKGETYRAAYFDSLSSASGRAARAGNPAASIVRGSVV